MFFALFYLSVFGLLALGIYAVDEEEVGFGFLVSQGLLLVILIFSFGFIESDMKQEAYKQGQVDCMNGTVKYEPQVSEPDTTYVRRDNLRKR